MLSIGLKLVEKDVLSFIIRGLQLKFDDTGVIWSDLSTVGYYKQAVDFIPVSNLLSTEYGRCRPIYASGVGHFNLSIENLSRPAIDYTAAF